MLNNVLRWLVRDVENQVSDALRKMAANVEGFFWVPDNDHMRDANLVQLFLLTSLEKLSF